MAEEGKPADEETPREVTTNWKAVVAQYRKPNRWRANWQIANSVGSYLIVWYLMYLSLSVSWWLTIPLALLAGGLLVRVFIIFHDCGHGSFFKSRFANNTWGFITGVLTFTPYYHWTREHAIHHATSGNLDRRGTGDIWTMTVDEYLNASRWKKLRYRLVRNPVILFFLGPLYLLLIRQRIPWPKLKRREKYSVWIMNLAVLIQAAGLTLIFGFIPWLIIQMTVFSVAGGAGVWLFYVQHQFEEAYWQPGPDWDYRTAALKGSSFYKLPKVLQWFSGNIGFHHIHHLSPRIPNYNLEACHRSNPMLFEVVPLTLLDSFKSIHFRLWDEKSGRLISFGELKRQKQYER